ncbi:MAG: DNA-binding protein Alba [Candidatus Nanoarchaeia archaeon]|jgi:DNA-binding protein
MGKNEVFIGNKPFMNYVTSVVMQFNTGSKEVAIKARGKYISKAVDVAEVARNRFLQDVLLKKVDISSEEFKEESKTVRVSSIEVVLAKK